MNRKALTEAYLLLTGQTPYEPGPCEDLLGEDLINGEFSEPSVLLYDLCLEVAQIANHRWFIDRGFMLGVEYEEENDREVLVVKYFDQKEPGIFYSGIKAICLFFNLEKEKAEWLFCRNSYTKEGLAPTTDDVTQRMKQILKLNREALLRLADKLEGKGPYEKEGPIAEEVFDLSEWRREDGCGTAACAIGHAATDPWFKERGLMLEPARTTPVCRTYTPTYHPEGETSKVKTYSTNWCAVRDFFNLQKEEATRLFTENENYKTPSQVAQRIRTFLNQVEDIEET